jgi:hypothetical protein
MYVYVYMFVAAAAGQGFRPRIRAVYVNPSASKVKTQLNYFVSQKATAVVSLPLRHYRNQTLFRKKNLTLLEVVL